MNLFKMVSWVMMWVLMFAAGCVAFLFLMLPCMSWWYDHTRIECEKEDADGSAENILRTDEPDASRGG